MTTDPALQSLFTATEQRYEDDDFTQKVMKKSRFVRYRTQISIGVSLLVMAIAITLVSTDVQTMILQVNNMLTTDIVDLGDGISSVALDPINTIAGLLFIVAKSIHIIYKWTKK